MVPRWSLCHVLDFNKLVLGVKREGEGQCSLHVKKPYYFKMAVSFASECCRG